MFSLAFFPRLLGWLSIPLGLALFSKKRAP